MYMYELLLVSRAINYAVAVDVVVIAVVVVVVVAVVARYAIQLGRLNTIHTRPLCVQMRQQLQPRRSR